MPFFTFVVCAFALQSCVHSLNFELFTKNTTKSVNPHLINITNSIIENIYMTRYSTVNIISAVANSKDSYFQDFRNALLHANKGFCIYRLDNYTKILTIKNRLKHYNIFLIDSNDTFSTLYSNITPARFNFRGYFLFVLINGDFDALPDLFHAMWSKRIINTNAIFVNKWGAVEIKTFLPFKKGNCGDMTPETWEEIHEGKFNKSWNNILPEKTKNLFGCPLRLVTFNRCPAACVEQKGNITTVTGFDMGIIQVVAEKLKFTLDTEILLGAEQWGKYVNRFCVLCLFN